MPEIKKSMTSGEKSQWILGNPGREASCHQFIATWQGTIQGSCLGGNAELSSLQLVFASGRFGLSAPEPLNQGQDKVAESSPSHHGFTSDIPLRISRHHINCQVSFE